MSPPVEPQLLMDKEKDDPEGKVDCVSSEDLFPTQSEDDQPPEEIEALGGEEAGASSEDLFPTQSEEDSHP